MNIQFRKRATLYLLILTAAAVTAALLLPKIPQDPGYHSFADTRTLLGIPNTLNVLSNFPLIVLGAVGIIRCRGIVQCLRRKNGNLETDFRGLKILFFSTVLLTGFGSSMYHWKPDDNTIVWDRIPLSIMFMALFLVILADRISPRIAGTLAWPAVIAGPLSVIYWRWSELQGAGDLRFYGIFQLLPLVLVPALIFLEPKGTVRNSDLWRAFAWYAFAKLAEFLDKPILDWTVLFSGHTLKHISAGIAVCYLLRICSLSNGRKSNLEIEKLEAA
jgi:hypothetical protein